MKTKDNAFNLLVHLHLFYVEQLDFFTDKLKNICGCNWDLYVTLVENNQDVIDKIRTFKPDAKIIIVPNAGYDVYPFIQVLKNVNLEKYDLILKLHTKKSIKDRNRILEPLIWNKHYFKNAVKKFKKHDQLGLLGHKVKQIFGLYPEEDEILDPLLNKLNIIDFKFGHYIPGTMFFIRSSILKEIIDMTFSEKDFCLPSGDYYSGAGASLAHALERVFGIITEAKGYLIEDTKNPIERIFNKLITTQNYTTHKHIGVFGIKIKIKR